MLARETRRVLLLIAALLPLAACSSIDEPAQSRGVFVDSPVSGLTFSTASVEGRTAQDGSFSFVAGEEVTFAVGSLVLGTMPAAELVTPLDFSVTMDDGQVYGLHVARLLQSLDANGDASDGITLTPAVDACVTQAVAARGGAVDLTDGEDITLLLELASELCDEVPGLELNTVGLDEATDHLLTSLEDYGEYFLRNISDAPELAEQKVKLELIRAPTAGMTADGTPTGESVLPLVASYGQVVAGTGAYDVYVAVSLDNGDTWRRINVSLSAERSSFVMPDGGLYPGDTRKASLKVDGRYFFLTWASSYCPDSAPNGIAADDDLFGVNGPQGSVDYTPQGFPEVGLVPYRCLWAARGMVQPNGSVVTLMPEQVTSGVRDALQDFPASVSNAGFAVAWQEDPAGLAPGRGEGPGHGWSGALANKRTDIWYSYVRWADFFRIDPDYDAAADPGNPDGRPRALVPMAAPTRLSDNAACRYADVHGDGSEPTGQAGSDSGCGNGGTVVTDPYCDALCVAEDEDGYCIDENGRTLRGNTAATRPNLFLLAVYDDEGNVVGAEAILGYEETKGTGDCESKGLDEGKYIRFHYMADFTTPPAIAAGEIFNAPNDLGEYENARRIRFVIQQRPGWGEGEVAVMALYRQGEEGTGHPADVFMRIARGGYDIGNFGPPVNMSSVTPILYGDSCEIDWEWSTENFADQSGTNPFDNARAHRGQVRGDFLVMGYTWTPNWAAAEIGAGHYDFYVRRSFNGGETWTDAEGVMEGPVNVSNLPDHVYTVIEPRIVATPGTVQVNGMPSTNPEWRQNRNTYFVAFGTEWNSPLNEVERGTPADLYYSRTTDNGETYELVTYADGYPGFPILAGTSLEEAECQMRMTPQGNVFYAGWNAEDATQSDASFRRIEY
jgi:hypothetical protein